MCRAAELVVFSCAVVVTWTAPDGRAPTGRETKKPEMDKRLFTWRATGVWRRWCSVSWNLELMWTPRLVLRKQSASAALFQRACLMLCSCAFALRMQKEELPSMLPLATSITSLYSYSFPIQISGSTFVTVKEWLRLPVPWRTRITKQLKLSWRGSQVLPNRWSCGTNLMEERFKVILLSERVCFSSGGQQRQEFPACGRSELGHRKRPVFDQRPS